MALFIWSCSASPRVSKAAETDALQTAVGIQAFVSTFDVHEKGERLLELNELRMRNIAIRISHTDAMATRCVACMKFVMSHKKIDIDTISKACSMLQSGTMTTCLRDTSDATEYDFVHHEDVLKGLQRAFSRFEGRASAAGRDGHACGVSIDLVYDVYTLRPFCAHTLTLCHILFVYAMWRCGLPVVCGLVSEEVDEKAAFQKAMKRAMYSLNAHRMDMLHWMSIYSAGAAVRHALSFCN